MSQYMCCEMMIIIKCINTVITLKKITILILTERTQWEIRQKPFLIANQITWWPFYYLAWNYLGTDYVDNEVSSFFGGPQIWALCSSHLGWYQFQQINFQPRAHYFATGKEQLLFSNPVPAASHLTCPLPGPSSFTHHPASLDRLTLPRHAGLFHTSLHCSPHEKYPLPTPWYSPILTRLDQLLTQFPVTAPGSMQSTFHPIPVNLVHVAPSSDHHRTIAPQSQKSFFSQQHTLIV